MKKNKNNMLNIFGSMVLKKLREVLRKFFLPFLLLINVQSCLIQYKIYIIGFGQEFENQVK